MGLACFPGQPSAAKKERYCSHSEQHPILVPSVVPAPAASVAPIQKWQGTKVREDVWRAWRLSGALLELTAWSSRQSPCLYHHLVAASSTSSSSPDEQQVLSQLQQQLQTRRKARQAAVEALQRRRKRQQRGGGSSSDDLDNDSPAGGSGVGGGSGSAVSWEFSAWQGCVVWGVVLAAAVGWSCARSSLVFTAPLVAAAAAVYAVASGVLLPSEAAVQQLAQVLDANGMQAALVSDTGFLLGNVDRLTCQHRMSDLFVSGLYRALVGQACVQLQRRCLMSHTCQASNTNIVCTLCFVLARPASPVSCLFLSVPAAGRTCLRRHHAVTRPPAARPGRGRPVPGHHLGVGSCQLLQHRYDTHAVAGWARAVDGEQCVLPTGWGWRPH